VRALRARKNSFIYPTQVQSGRKSEGLPMSGGHGVVHPLAPHGPAVAASHLGARRFHRETPGPDRSRLSTTRFAAAAALAGGPARWRGAIFLRRSPSRCSTAHIHVRLSCSQQLCSSCSASFCSVRSGCRRKARRNSSSTSVVTWLAGPCRTCGTRSIRPVCNCWRRIFLV
jgi:hypothetical protein